MPGLPRTWPRRRPRESPGIESLCAPLSGLFFEGMSPQLLVVNVQIRPAAHWRKATQYDAKSAQMSSLRGCRSRGLTATEGAGGDKRGNGHGEDERSAADERPDDLLDDHLAVEDDPKRLAAVRGEHQEKGQRGAGVSEG